MNNKYIEYRYIGTKAKRYKNFLLINDFIIRYGFSWRGGADVLRNYNEYKEKSNLYVLSIKGQTDMFYGDGTSGSEILLDIDDFIRYVKKTS